MMSLWPRLPARGRRLPDQIADEACMHLDSFVQDTRLVITPSSSRVGIGPDPCHKVGLYAVSAERLKN